LTMVFGMCFVTFRAWNPLNCYLPESAELLPSGNCALEMKTAGAGKWVTHITASITRSGCGNAL